MMRCSVLPEAQGWFQCWLVPGKGMYVLCRAQPLAKLLQPQRLPRSLLPHMWHSPAISFTPVLPEPTPTPQAVIDVVCPLLERRFGPEGAALAARAAQQLTAVERDVLEVNCSFWNTAQPVIVLQASGVRWDGDSWALNNTAQPKAA